LRRPKHHPGPGVFVELDWIGVLPTEQLKAFKSYAKQLEDSYSLFSVSLDEAISLHNGGRVGQSFEAIAFTLPLCDRLIESLGNILRSIAEHCKAHGTMPSVLPLSPGDFHGEWGRRSALVSLKWHQALLSQESQFRNKIGTLRSMVEQLGRDFRAAADALASPRSAIESPDLWAVMDRAHFDLNTCLRESIVSLKCFFMVLPDGEFRTFQEGVFSDEKPSPKPKAKRAAATTAPAQS
jgi:hypothetical protein